MNKAALKSFATNARKELLERVELQARKLGITKEKIEAATFESSDAVFIRNRQLTDVERKQRNKLITRIEMIGFDQVIEETAYTWFNRFVALRFMEVNDYLPTRVRVLSSEYEDSTEPDMLKEALSLDLAIDKEYVYDLKMKNNTDELFKYLIKLHCNDLNRYMPFMFETIEDYMAILFPEGLLGPDSFVREMTDTAVIPEEDWEKVEIIGWLYQYYISDEKDTVFTNLKKNIKITKETLPAATQLFTPNWIVRYMVENSLGRLWLESYPDTPLKKNWTYFLEEADQEKTVMNQLESIRYNDVNPEEITFLDPACGSGHILVYAFDVLYDMYLEKGYLASEIPKLILEKNLYGIDVDQRASQLASFSLLMKAREKSRRIFRQQPQLNIIAIQDSTWMTSNVIEQLAKDDPALKNDLQTIKSKFEHAKEYGSLLKVDDLNCEHLNEVVKKYLNEETDLFAYSEKERISASFPKLLKQIDFLTKKYDIVCTNPPYMGRRSMAPLLNKFLDKNFPNTKADLFSAFIERGFDLTKENGFNTMVTMQSWMFLSTFEKMRATILENKLITNLLHMDNMVMGIAFGTSATVFRNCYIDGYNGRFTEIKYNDLNDDHVPDEFPNKQNRRGTMAASHFRNIPGRPLAYWIDNELLHMYEKYKPVKDYSEYSGAQNKTANNNKYIRYHWEVNANDMNHKWIKIAKGGPFRKWYGNIEEVIDWSKEATHFYETNKTSCKMPDKYLFRRGITWTKVSNYNKPAFRSIDQSILYETASPTIHLENNFAYVLGLLNSKVGHSFIRVTKQTMNFQIFDIVHVPVRIDETKEAIIQSIVNQLIDLYTIDATYEEALVDFKHIPILQFNRGKMIDAFDEWKILADERRNTVKKLEEELNRHFIDIYGLQEVLTPEIAEEDITIRKANLERDVKDFISYAVGCMFGRYSLDEEGVVYAGGEFEPDRYKTFPIVENNILPILPGAYFADDLVNQFITFVDVTYGKDTLEENLEFIANAIGRRKNETAREAIRRYFLVNFYKDHVRTFKKHPIYWYFTSGREQAFNCFIYMHRYDKTTLSRIRTEYLHEVQTRYESERQDLQAIIEGDATAKEIRDATRELKAVDRKLDELKVYDEKLHHLADMQIDFDLDDGIKENYKKFAGLVAKI